MCGTITSIALAFIAVALLVVMVDQITKVIQGIMKSIPFLPDQFEWTFAYMILMGIASAVCWQGHFDLFTHLNFTWCYKWEGYLLTGALIAGGSSLLVKQFRVMGLIPTVVGGVTSMFGMGSSSASVVDPSSESTQAGTGNSSNEQESSQ